jgi:hypothetical protein
MRPGQASAGLDPGLQVRFAGTITPNVIVTQPPFYFRMPAAVATDVHLAMSSAI